MTRRTTSFVAVAAMLFLQFVLLGGLAIWSTYAGLTRIMLGVLALSTLWAVTFLTFEAIAAAATGEESDAPTMVDPQLDDSDAADSSM